MSPRLRYYLKVTLVSGALMGAVTGLPITVMVLLDAYPVVPAEGFSFQRKLIEVAAWSAYGVIIGLAAGPPIAFGITLVESLLERRRRVTEAKHG
jgi:Na+(H+)/acetate symporter ActP